MALSSLKLKHDLILLALDPLNHSIIVLGQLCSGVWPVVGSNPGPTVSIFMCFLLKPCCTDAKTLSGDDVSLFPPSFQRNKRALNCNASRAPSKLTWLCTHLENWAKNAQKKRHGEKSQDERSLRDRNEQRTESENQKDAFSPPQKPHLLPYWDCFQKCFLFMNWGEIDGSLGQKEVRFLSEGWRRREELTQDREERRHNGGKRVFLCSVRTSMMKYLQAIQPRFDTLILHSYTHYTQVNDTQIVCCNLPSSRQELWVSISSALFLPLHPRLHLLPLCLSDHALRAAVRV